MKYILIFALGLLLMSMAPLAVSSPEYAKLSQEEKEKLSKGEIIYQSVKTEDTQGKTSGYGQSMALIKAPIDQCWEIFNRFEQQPEYWPRKTASIVIDSKPGFALVQKKFKFYWATIGYVVRYQIDANNHRIDYSIDPTRPHDIKDTAGFFIFEKVGPDQTLFTYAVTRLDTGISLPSFIQEYMQKRDLPAVAENVKKKIESGGTWKKAKE